MKRTICLILSLTASLSLLSGCGKKADTYTVTLDANATTGYEWSVSADRQGVVEKTSYDYIPDSNAEGIVGSGGKAVFVFAAKEDGDVVLTFAYARPWETEPIEKRTLQLTVKSGRITETG